MYVFTLWIWSPLIAILVYVRVEPTTRLSTDGVPWELVNCGVADAGRMMPIEPRAVLLEVKWFIHCVYIVILIVYCNCFNYHSCISVSVLKSI